MNTAFLGLKLLTGEMKASKDPRDIERYDTLCDVNMSCMAAVDILNDLLCYEKLDSGILELHKEDVIVLPFITQCVSMFSVQAKECGVKMFVLPAAANVDFRTEGSLYQEPLTIEPYDSIHVDKFKMDQVIRNLVSNALKFTPRGGTVTVQASFIHDSVLAKLPHSDLERRSSVILNAGCASIFNYFKEKFPLRRRSNRVASEHESDLGPNNSAISLTGKLVVVVVDSGAGISIENQKRLFKDIVQFNPEKLQAGGGSGLGLWITKGIVDLHGGNISVNSMGEGMGSSFTVEIPMVRPMHLESLENDSPVIETDSLRMSRPVSPIRIAQRGLSSPPKFPTPTPLWDVVSTTIGSSTSNTRLPIFDVLVVDDSRLNRKMLLKCLTKDGHICTEAEDGLEAIERVKERIDFSNGGHGRSYDAILMDFVMPNMDGPTATKQLRTMGYTGAIFGVTGNGMSKNEL